MVGVTLPLAIVLADHDGHADGGDVLALACTRIDLPAGLDRNLMARNLERRLVVAEHAAHEHLERRLGALVLPAKRLLFLDVVPNRSGLLEGDLDSTLVKFTDDVADPRKFRDQETIGVSHSLRPNVLVRPLLLCHSGCVQSRLMYEGG